MKLSLSDHLCRAAARSTGDMPDQECMTKREIAKAEKEMAEIRRNLRELHNQQMRDEVAS